MSLRSTLTDIADRERHEAEAAVPHFRNPELLSRNFDIIAEYARARIERILAAERKHEANGHADTQAVA